MWSLNFISFITVGFALWLTVTSADGDSDLKHSLRVNIAHVVNPQEVSIGGGLVKPQMRFIGPFVYDVKVTKGTVSQNANGTLTFTYRKTYTFNAKESVAREDGAYFLVPSAPYMRFVSSKDYDEERIAQVLSESADVKPFVLVTVRDLLWGYEDPLLTVLHAKGLSNQTRFGVFLDDPEIRGETLTVAPAPDDITSGKYKAVELINGSADLGAWESGCNQIHGVDFMDPDVRVVPLRTYKSFEPLYFLSSHACGPIGFSFKQEETDGGGHEILRYEPDQNLFTTNMMSQKCFCRGGTDCPSRGTLDLFKCKPGLTLSWPFFKLADDSVLSGHGPDFQLRGDNPYDVLELAKENGRVERFMLSLQYNVWMKRVNEISATHEYPNVLLPLIQTTDLIAPLLAGQQDIDSNKLEEDIPEAAELKKEAKKVVKHLVVGKKLKKKKSGASALEIRNSIIAAMLLGSSTFAIVV